MENIRLLQSFVFLALLSVSIQSDAENVPAEHRMHHSLVDQLTDDYVVAERYLWTVIERRESSTLQQIYNNHTYFLNIHYGQSNMLFNLELIEKSPKIVASVNKINETSLDIANEFFGRRRNYTVLSMKAFNGITIDKLFDEIYNDTINSTDFWSSIRKLTDGCKMPSFPIQSEHQFLFEYYKDIQAASLRTYITAQLSYMILHLHESGNFREQAIEYRERFIQLHTDIQDAFKTRLREANRNIWACDPSDYHAPGANTAVTKFLQGYIESEVNLNSDGSCALTCGDYQNTKHHACRPDSLCAAFDKKARSKMACKGRIRGCSAFDDSISVCASDNATESRYKFVQSSTGLKLGDITSCSNEGKASAWTRWFVKCSNCFCYCDDSTDSERHFSLREVTSDIEHNKIVTGVSLTKVNGVFQFSIAQHKLQAYGSVGFVGINEAWKLASSFDLNENSTHEGVDYHTLTYENRSINLDTIVVPEGRVVTGVRFNRNDIGHLRLEVRVTEIDLRAGKLNNLEQSVWLSNVDGGKSRIKVDNMDLPTKSPKPSTPNFKENTYVRFSPSHRKVDVSQSTVPFIDTLRVEPIIHVPLSGVGLIYKSQSGYGGFIAPQIVLYKFEPIVSY